MIRKIRPEDLNASIRDIPLPNMMLELPVDKRGYPVPYFAAYLDGEWNFLVAGEGKYKMAVRKNLCWVCGNQMGSKFAFVTGPMCVITTTTAEPPCHQSCAEYAAIACPFLANPNMKRNETGLPAEHVPAPGMPIMRNPGVAAVLTTRRYDLFNDGEDRALIRMGKPEAISWWARRRPATQEEVLESMKGGLELLKAECDKEDGVIAQTEAHAELNRQVVAVLPWLPPVAASGGRRAEE